MNEAVDMKTIRRLSTQVDDLRASGQWDKAAFDRVWKAAVTAANGQDEVLETFLLHADPAWE